MKSMVFKTIGTAVAFFFSAIPQVWAQNGPPPLPPTPLSIWALDGTNWDNLRHQPPLGFTNLNSVPSWLDIALSVDTNDAPAFLSVPIYANGYTNLTFASGSLAFWCQPNWTSVADGGSGPGAWAPLWQVGTYTTNNLYGCWSLGVSPDGNTLAFVTQTNGAGDRLTDSDVPNATDDNGTNFIFVHGYNVNPNQARGWQSEMFKRVYWSGSHARFYGVTWDAYDTQKYQFVTINLQTNIVHAFQTAPAFSTFLNSLPGTNVVMAHSLGNMLVLSALNDYTNTTVNTFLMVDAAVALEAIDGAAAINTNMVPPDWQAYPNRVWASEWFNLFASSDARNQLTWSNRLANFNGAQVYNLYSSGEEVLRNYYGAPLSLSGLAQQAITANVWSNTPLAVNLWGLQEKEKGRMTISGILGSTHGGWGYNTNYGTISSPPNPTVVAALTSSQIQTNPVFNTDYDGQLFGSGGSTYAHVNRNGILSDAIPAVSWATGANPVPHEGIVATSIDMQNFETGWPAIRPQGSELDHWYHSDVREVAYPYTHSLFDYTTFYGGLR